MIRIWKTVRYCLVSIKAFLFDFFDLLIYYKVYKSLIDQISGPVVVFVTDKFIPRVDKLNFALISAGLNDIVLISRNRKYPFSGEYKAYFTVRSPFKTIWLAKKLHPRIIHVFSSWNFDLAYFLIKQKGRLSVKVVFDDYDVFAGMLKENVISKYHPFQLKKEKYCFENADGLCCRSLETQYARQKLHYNLKAKRIFFPEYMYDIFRAGSKTKINTLVYIGNFNVAVTELAEKLKHIGWVLEIYPAHFAMHYLSKMQENLIIHKPLTPIALIDELRHYPLAIQLPGSILDHENSIYTSYKYLYAASGKVFDYLEAGLKVLISDEIFQKWLLNRYDAAIEFREENALEEIVVKLSNFEPQNFINNKKLISLTLNNQAPRLVKFYNSLTAEC